MIEFERTKKLAKNKKMSLREVNDKAKLGTNSIYKWKSNKPGSDALAAVAKVLSTTTDYLKGLTDDLKYRALEFLENFKTLFLCDLMF